MRIAKSNHFQSHRCETDGDDADTAYTYGGGDPVNGGDPTGLCTDFPTRTPTISSQLASLGSSLTSAVLMPYPSTCENGTFCDTMRRAGKLLGLLVIPRRRSHQMWSGFGCGVGA